MLTIGVSITFFLFHFLYVFLSQQFPKWDEYIFLDEAVSLHEAIRNGTLSFSKYLEIFTQRPPFYVFSIIPFTLIFGLEHVYRIALLVNGFYYALTIIGMYFLGSIFFSKKISFVTAFIFACLGFPLFYSHFAYSETSAIPFMVFSLYFLFKTKTFSEKKNTFLFSLFFALSFLTRWTMPVFIIAPFILKEILLIKNNFKLKHLKDALINISLIGVVALGIPILLYYGPEFSEFQRYISSSRAYSPEWVSSLAYLSPELINTFSTRSIMFYFNIISQITIYLFIPFAIGVALSLIKFKKYFYLFLCFIFPYIFFTFFVVLKDDRYILPIYPFVALLIALFINQVKYFKIQLVFILIVMGISVLNYLGGFWGMGPLAGRGLYDIVLPEFIHHPRRIYLTGMVWPPRRHEIPAREIAQYVIQNSPDNPTVLNTYTYNPLELDNALSSLEHYELRGSFKPANLRVIDRGDYAELFERIQNAKFLLVKEGDPVVSNTKYTNEPTDQMIVIVSNILKSNPNILNYYTKRKIIYYPLEKINLVLYEKKLLDRAFWQLISDEAVKTDPNYSDQILKAQTQTK